MAQSGGFLSGTGVHPDLFPGKTRARMSQARQEYDRRVGHYEKEFNINLSRIASKERDLRDNMLSYSEHARKLTNHKLLSESLPDVSLLRVRARNIPNRRSQDRKLPKLLPLMDGTESSKIQPPKSVDPFQRKMVALRAGHAEIGTTTDEATDMSFAQPTTTINQRQSKEELRMSSVSVSDLGQMENRKRTHRSKPRTSWGIMQPSTSWMSEVPNVTLTAANNDADRDKSESRLIDDQPHLEDKSISAGAEHSRKRREARTRLLLREAIASLRAMEENIKNPLLTLPKLRRGKRLKLPKGKLDVIPENFQEEETTGGAVREDGIHVDDQMSTSRSEPKYKTLRYHHAFPLSNSVPTLDGSTYTVQSDTFEPRPLRTRKSYPHSVNDYSSGGDRSRPTSKRRPSVTLALNNPMDVPNAERKRKRLQRHARAKLSRPPRIKFLRNDREEDIKDMI